MRTVINNGVVTGIWGSTQRITRLPIPLRASFAFATFATIGEVRLDTVLNSAELKGQSHVLVVDEVVIGGAASEVVVNSAEVGFGAPTGMSGNADPDAGEGILVIGVLGAPAPGALSMEPVADSGFQ